MEIELWWLLVLPVFFAFGWVAARIDIKHLLQESRALPRSYFKGLNFLLNEQPDQAIEAFIEAARVDPETIELHFALGNLFRRRGETDRAIRVHQNLIDRDGLTQAQRLHALAELGQDYLKAGLLDRAEEIFIKLRDTERNEEALKNLLEIYQQEKEWAKAIVVAATSDVPALERVRSAEIATAYAEWLRDRGMRVLLVVDSITRYARALREIGLSVGEPPTRRGFPPSVFAALPRLLERAGRAGGGGSITAIYTVLVEGGDLDEPVADEVRGILDGHIVLDRGLAERGRFPAVNAPASVSRLMGAVATKEHQRLAARLRALLVAYEGKRDLVQLGAYAKGADKTLDEALAKLARIERLLSQGPGDPATFASTVGALEDLVG